MNYYIFLIDTEQYAGNFERQLTAWCTGVVGECGVGSEHAAAFARRYPGLEGEFDTVMLLPDEHGRHRPTAIFPTPGWSSDRQGNNTHDDTGAYHAYQSVGVFLESMPTPETIAFLQARSLSYVPLRPFDRAITITGFRMLRHVEEETLVAAYPLPAPCTSEEVIDGQ